jgi:PAS domain-containing protein
VYARRDTKPARITMSAIHLADDEPPRLLLIVEDLTEEERLQAARQESEQRYRDLIHGLDAIVWEADAHTLAFSFVSRRAETVLGYPVERWLREPDFWAHRIHPDDRDRVMQTYRAAIAESRDHEFEYRALVEREALMAMDLKKPLHIALIEDIPLPLHLINRQFTDFRNERGRATKKLTSVLRRLDLTKPKTRAPKKLSPEPDKDNFFKYLAQLPGGEQNALIARDLYRWAKDNADTIEFGGKVTPGFHVRVDLGDSDIIVFSLWGYRRKPAVQVQFQYMAEVAPYHDSKLRRSTLVSLNRLLDDPLIDDAADRRPTLPLRALDAAAKLEMFQQIMAEIMDNLRSV